MERESDRQPVQLKLGPIDWTAKGQPLRLVFLSLAMLAPWFWVWLGLHVLKDYRLTILMYEVLGCGLPILLIRNKPLPPLWPFRFKRRWILSGAVGVNLIILGVFWQTNSFNMDWEWFYQRMQTTHLFVNTEFWLLALCIVLLNPFFEEMFWRGIIYQELKDYTTPLKANLISSFFFGAWHWVVLQAYCTPFWALWLTVAVMLGGILFAYTYEKSGTLASAVMLHATGADLPMVYVVYSCVTQAGQWMQQNPFM